MKKSHSNLKKLSLSKETVRFLSKAQLERVAGGEDTLTGKCSPTANCSITC